MYVDVYYIIKPKEIMKDVVEYDKYVFFTGPHIWKNEEFIRPDMTPNPAHSVRLVKMVFMLEVINLRNSTKSDREILGKLFGNPMKFSMEMFDKWWTIEEIRMYRGTQLVIDRITSEQINLLESDGYEDVIKTIRFRQDRDNF